MTALYLLEVMNNVRFMSGLFLIITLIAYAIFSFIVLVTSAIEESMFLLDNNIIRGVFVWGAIIILTCIVLYSLSVPSETAELMMDIIIKELQA